MNDFYRHFKDLRTLPTTDRTTHEKLQSRELIRVAPWIAMPSEVYFQLEHYEQLEVKAIAAGLSTYRAVITSRSAARIHGLWTLSEKREKVELCLPSGSRVTSKKSLYPGYLYRSGAMPESDYKVINGIRLASRPRTCVDIARYHGLLPGIVAMDSLLATGYLASDVQLQIDVMGRFRGSRNARRALNMATALSESPFESLARAILLSAEIPEVSSLIPQMPIDGRFRADLCINGWLIVEIDGESKYDFASYGQDPTETILNERRREKELLNRGFEVLRYSPRQLMFDPDGLIRDVRLRLAKRLHRAA